MKEKKGRRGLGVGEGGGDSRGAFFQAGGVWGGGYKKGGGGVGVGGGGGDFKVVILQVERVLGRSVQNLQETGRTPGARIRRVK